MIIDRARHYSRRSIHTSNQGETIKADNSSNVKEEFFDPDAYLPKLDGENVISMSLWGSDRKYTAGAIRNAELIKEFFPGWKLRIYTEMPTAHARYGIVSSDVIKDLRNLQV